MKLSILTINQLIKTQRVFSGVRIIQSCVLSVVLVNHYLPFCPRPCEYCIVHRLVILFKFVAF